MKHLFSVAGVIFVVATDSTQLVHSIKAVYGSGFDARRYLRRFFDRVFIFPDTNRKDYVEYLLDKNGLTTPGTFYQTLGYDFSAAAQSWATAFGLSNRDIEQCLDAVQVFVSSWRYKTPIEPFFLLSLIFLYHRGDLELLKMVSRGQIVGSTIFDNWSIPYRRYKDGEMVGASITATALIQTLFSSGLLDISARPNTQSETFRPLIVSEIGAVHNNQLYSNKQYPSVILEYGSRVANAGRYVEG